MPVPVQPKLPRTDDVNSEIKDALNVMMENIYVLRHVILAAKVAHIAAGLSQTLSKIVHLVTTGSI